VKRKRTKGQTMI